MIELTDEEADVLRRLLRVVGGVVPEFIIAGGQAARLLRLHPLATRLKWNPLLTNDTDVATVDKGHRGNDLAKAFEAEGFTATLEGDDMSPRTHYLRGAAEIELIVPDIAGRHRRGLRARQPPRPEGVARSLGRSIRTARPRGLQNLVLLQ